VFRRIALPRHLARFAGAGARDDADLEAAIHGAVADSLIDTGQDRTAATRAYVHRSRYDDC
jgi:acyl-CoA reductase-like NAD-dependent aldehyde dehydrogenase